MILRRLGNKKAIAHKIVPHFPPHKIFISPFFGAGGMFFNKPKVKYNIVNDIDSDVFNLFQVVINQKKELKEALFIMPVHSDLFEYWKKNKETEPVKKALRFLFLSNFGYLGNSGTMRLSNKNAKKILYNNIQKTFDLIFDVDFANFDFRKFLEVIPLKENEKKETFIYNDPPYVNTSSNYEPKKWTELDFVELLDCNIKTDCKFAISEFNNEFVISEAKKRNLNIITIGERQSLKNRNIEILITNYKNDLTLF